MEHAPGDTTPTTGYYELHNVFGSRTGRTEHVTEGEPLLAAPRGHTWRRVDSDGRSHFAADRIGA